MRHNREGGLERWGCGSCPSVRLWVYRDISKNCCERRTPLYPPRPRSPKNARYRTYSVHTWKKPEEEVYHFLGNVCETGALEHPFLCLSWYHFSISVSCYVSVILFPFHSSSFYRIHFSTHPFLLRFFVWHLVSAVSWRPIRIPPFKNVMMYVNDPVYWLVPDRYQISQPRIYTWPLLDDKWLMRHSRFSQHIWCRGRPFIAKSLIFKCDPFQTTLFLQ